MKEFNPDHNFRHNALYLHETLRLFMFVMSFVSFISLDFAYIKLSNDARYLKVYAHCLYTYICIYIFFFFCIYWKLIFELNSITAKEICHKMQLHTMTITAAAKNSTTAFMLTIRKEEQNQQQQQRWALKQRKERVSNENWIWIRYQKKKKK